MSQSAAAPLGPEALPALLGALPDGIVVFGHDWTIDYINPAGAALLGRDAGALTGQSVWVALPELEGTILHSFLLRARSVASPVTWHGYYPPAHHWISATSLAIDGRLLLSFREADTHPHTGHAAGADHSKDPGDAAEPDQDGEQDRLRFLAEVSEAMIATLDTGKSATRLAELVAGRLCDWAVVALVGEDGGPDQESWAHRDPNRRADLDVYLHGRERSTGDNTAMVNALLTGEPVQITTFDPARTAASLPTEQVRAAWAALDTTSCTIVPLRARGETFGALALLNSGRRRAHSERQVAIAVEVARRGALALDNARLYGRQLKVAETLQHSLLTPPPQPDHLQIEVRYRPAASDQQVGGDWYDAFQQPDGATMLVIGDVVGHNIDAAAAMGQIRSILRGIAYDRPETPAQVLTRVDNVLTGLHVGTMATALVARLEQPPEQARAGRHILRWSSAGHLPPVVLTPAGDVTLLGTHPERLLGAGSAVTRTDHEHRLEPGDVVLFCTDGLIEHGRTGIDEGLTRLTATLRQLNKEPLDELCDQLLDRIVTGRADDDIALLALRCGPTDGP